MAMKDDPPLGYFLQMGSKNEIWATYMPPTELTAVLLQEKVAQPSGQTMEPENIEINFVPDLLSNLYYPSLGSVVSSTFPHQAWVFL